MSHQLAAFSIAYHRLASLEALWEVPLKSVTNYCNLSKEHHKQQQGLYWCGKMSQIREV